MSLNAAPTRAAALPPDTAPPAILILSVRARLHFQELRKLSRAGSRSIVVAAEAATRSRKRVGRIGTVTTVAICESLRSRRRSRTRSPRRVRPWGYSGSSRWTHTWRGASCRCRRSCRDRRSRWRWSNAWNWSRSRRRRRCGWCGRWCYSRCWRRCSCRHLKSIYLVISAEVDPTASNRTGIPLTCAGHLLVRPAAGINNSPCVAVVRVQPLVALNAGHPDNRVVGSISHCHPWRTAAVLTYAPCAHDRRRVCCGNLEG